MIGKLPNKATASLNKKTLRLIGRDPLSFKSITADNGAITKISTDLFVSVSRKQKVWQT